MIRASTYLLLLLFFNGCFESFDDSTVAINDIKVEYTNLTAYVRDREGKPLADVSVHLRYQDVSTLSDTNGLFTFSNILSKNDILEIRKDLYYNAIYTYSPENTYEVQTYTLDIKSPETARLLFTGDLSFARRYMDPKSPDRTIKLITEDVADALLKTSDLYGSGQSLINNVIPLFLNVDFPIVNLESITTQYQYTLDHIHPTKDYAYYSNSLSLPLLKDLNVNFVTLGNNHVYDYNSFGLGDTMDALDSYQIKHSGAGPTVEEAFTPYRTQIEGIDFSFVGATSIRGDKHEILYVAHEQNLSDEDPYITQGGAADAHDSIMVTNTLKGESDAGFFPVYQLHGGIEYTHGPNSVVLKLLHEAIDNGAALAISHHPHTAQGYGMKDGTLMAYGMGNFIFDQDRLDTLLSHILVCDINQTGVTHAVGYPIYLEDYIPKLLTGDLANNFIKHISEASRNDTSLKEISYDNNFMMFPYQYKEYLSLDNQFIQETKSINIEVVIPSKGYETIDLRHLLPSEYSLSKITTTSTALNITIGRDLLWFGSFEDNDIDNKSPIQVISATVRVTGDKG